MASQNAQVTQAPTSTELVIYEPRLDRSLDGESPPAHGNPPRSPYLAGAALARLQSAEDMSAVPKCRQRRSNGGR